MFSLFRASSYRRRNRPKRRLAVLGASSSSALEKWRHARGEVLWVGPPLSLFSSREGAFRLGDGSTRRRLGAYRVNVLGRSGHMFSIRERGRNGRRNVTNCYGNRFMRLTIDLK